MNNKIVESVKVNETCFECGESVKFGSGKYVNRIPSLDDVEIRKGNGAEFPEGDFICAECDESFDKDGSE